MGKLTGQKPPLQPKHVRAIRTRLQLAKRRRDLALFNLAIDSKLRDCIWKIVEDTPDRRIPILDRMIADPRFANFRDAALTLRAEAGRQMALQDFRAPHPSEINKAAR